jgi:PEGA domain
MRWGPPLLVLAIAARAASASTGVVVVGDEKLRTQIAHELEGWLAHHGHELRENTLDNDGISTIANCLQIDDLPCAGVVVDTRSKTHDVVFAQVSMRGTAIALDVYWLVKGHPPLAERRACEDCTPDVLTGTVDSIMSALSASQGALSGRLTVNSRPQGLTVIIDEQVAGVSPVVRDLATGPHHVVLVDGTVRVGSRDIVIHPTETPEITITAHRITHPSRVPGTVALGLGITAVAVGGVMYALSPTDDGSHYRYRDYRPAAIGIGLGGLAVVIAGTVLLLHERGGSSVPIASIDSHGGTIGWARAF